MEIILYTTHCPMCNLLKSKLDAANIKYTICEDVDLMISKGFQSSPILEVDGKTMIVKDALKWVEENK